MSNGTQHYYVPDESKWPLIGSIGLAFFAVGAVGMFQSKLFGPYSFMIGVALIIYMLQGWFANVINESQKGLYSAQMDRSFRWGMGWFIFSEVMFFVVFFGVLFYVRQFSVPWLGGAGNNAWTNLLLWPDFTAAWPLLSNPNNAKFVAPVKDMGPVPLPLYNTIILVASSFTISFAHHALIAGKRQLLNIWMAVTILLGSIFLALQAYEYYEAYTHLKLTINSGIYGSTFYALTGFHGLHVTIGTIMLFTIFVRCLKGHFTADNHFAFEASAWYWHFVDVVWLILFLYVYVFPLR